MANIFVLGPDCAPLGFIGLMFMLSNYVCMDQERTRNTEALHLSCTTKMSTVEKHHLIAMNFEFIVFLCCSKLQLKLNINEIQRIQVNNNKLIQHINGNFFFWGV